MSDFLKKQPITHIILWKQTKELIHDTQESCFIIDDSVQEKTYARAIELLYPHYSENKHRVVQGIDIVNLVHSSGQNTFYPVDYRIYAPQYQKEKKTKNDYFLEMLWDAFEIKKIQASYILLTLGMEAFKILTISINQIIFFILLSIKTV